MISVWGTLNFAPDASTHFDKRKGPVPEGKSLVGET
jgi:hypothetical protein